jgi:hypothetical protein
MRAALIIAALALSAPTSVWAQAPEQEASGDAASADGDADAEAARTLFDEGMRELAAERYDGAAVLFRQSLERAPRAATAFNLGLALRDAERPREAMIVVQSLERGDYGALAADRHEEVERLREEIAEQVATLEVRLAGAERAVLRIDGEDEGVLVEDDSLTAWLDPGPHDVVAAVTDGPSVEERIDVEAGERTRMVLNVTAGTVVVESDEGGSAWPWVLLGVGLAAAAGVVVAVILATSASAGPTTDPVYGRIETLRF